jgi:acyl-CoA reductase-like NAD-dependent aldehyde dehydrogenase
MPRLEVLKTYKMYIGGQFPRTESARYYALNDKKGKVIANICLGSRKDFRNAIEAARKAFGEWSGKTAYNRSQVIYRIAEMMEGRKSQFVDELVLQGLTTAKAATEVSQAIDLIVYYAGWAD